MCGFAGIFNFRATTPNSIDCAKLNEMGAQIAHRGPDATACYSDEFIGLSHRRLSIIDIEGGSQPMISSDKKVVLVFNGEVFNFIELRRDLERKGVIFRTRSDTEVVLELYRRRGLAFVNELNGQFSIALWLKKERVLHLIRDRIGICPLFYTVDDGRFIFGSEIKALIPALRSSPSISVQSLDQVFTFWAPISPNTIFDEIYEVSPGQIITVSDCSISEQRYWEWPVPTDGYASAEKSELSGTLHDLLVNATQIRLRSDVPVGAYLSGGLDSSTIVSLVLAYTDSTLRTFSLTFDDRAFDESEYQAMLVKHAKVNHSKIGVARHCVGENLKKTIWHTETPILRSAPVPMGLLSQHVRESGFKVVLTGEGADEVLGGYDIFKEAKVRRFWAKQPESEIRPLLLKRLYPYLTLPKGKNAEYLKKFFGMGITQAGSLGFSHLPRWMMTAKAKHFLSEDVRAHLSTMTIDAYIDSLPDFLKWSDPFNVAQFIESKTLMSSYLLSSQGDRMLMMNSVEGRFPFLDHRVIEFAASIPPNLKMKVLNEKYLLKNAVGKYLPSAILDRHKQPYRAPDVVLEAADAGRDQLEDVLSDNNLMKAGYFDAKKVGLLKKKAKSRGQLSTSESQAMTGILTTQLVYEQFCQL